LEKTRPARLGFSTDNILVAPLTLDEDDYDEAKSQEFYRSVSERVAALPGVQAVSLVDVVPGGILGRSRRSTDIEGYKRQPGESREIDSTVAGPAPHRSANISRNIVDAQRRSSSVRSSE
jgi:hypothetical protein